VEIGMKSTSKRHGSAVVSCAVLFLATVAPALASDHLDTPSVIADPRNDIGDLYAWTSTDGRRLNLVMTIVGHSFSRAIDYLFHVDSGERYGKTSTTTTIACRFSAMNAADCKVGTADRIVGDPAVPAGLAGREGRSRLFAGLRDDPFFNNVKGSRAAFDYAAGQLHTTRRDPAACPLFDKAQAREILNRWRHTGDGPAQDFLAGWTPASIVLSVDLDVVNQGGALLAVWAETASGGRRIDRAARPLTGNALLGPLEPDEVSDSLKERYNEASPATAAPFVAEIEKSLALYDGYDGQCGNQLLADKDAAPAERYRPLATMLADDRLWVNSAASSCTQMFAVELAALKHDSRFNSDCGGRTPTYDAANIYRSMLATGTASGIDDGLHRDALDHSAQVFPFLAAPASQYQTTGKR
jgi:hypothetical protein